MRRSPVLLLLIITLAFISTDRVTIKDLLPALGRWKGTLTYLDYSSGKPYTMPAHVTITRDLSDQLRLILAFEYPELLNTRMNPGQMEMIHC